MSAHLQAKNEKNMLPKHARVIGICRELKGERILDVGCGDGSFSVLLKEAAGAREICGIEISLEAASSAEGKGIKTVCVDLDLMDFPFEDCSFDGVFAGSIIEHLSRLDHFLEEIHRVLKPGGWAIISTANISSWHSRLHLLMGYQPYPISVFSNRSRRRIGAFMHPIFSGHDYLDDVGHGGRDHVQFLTFRALKEFAELHGFRCEKTQGSPDAITINLSGWLYSVASVVDRIMSRIPALASHMIIVLIK